MNNNNTPQRYIGFIVLRSIEMYFQRKIKSLLVPFATVLFILYSSTAVEKIEGQSLEVVTLYDENDDVVELYDDTIDQIVDSGQIWVVEFYAHWCGHCQRFAPQWKEVAKQFKGIQFVDYDCIIIDA